jgi:hypothetical protein
VFACAPSTSAIDWNFWFLNSNAPAARAAGVFVFAMARVVWNFNKIVARAAFAAFCRAK